MTSSAQTSGFAEAAARTRRLVRSTPVRTVTRWREWKLPVKLVAMLVIPILIALGAGGTLIWERAAAWQAAGNDNRLTQIARSVSTVLSEVQAERALAVTAGPALRLTTARADVDSAAAQLTSMLTAAGIDSAPADAARQQLARLTALRPQTGAVQLAAGYTAITSALLDLDAALIARIGDRTLAARLDGGYQLARAHEYLSEQQSLAEFALAGGKLGATGLALLRAATTQSSTALAQFTASAPAGEIAAFDAAVPGPALDARDALVTEILDTGGNFHASVPIGQWRATAGPVVTQTGTLLDRLADDSAAQAAALDSGADLQLPVLGLLVAALLAAGVALALGRELTGSLRLLRRTALDIARNTLPEALREVRDGHTEGLSRPRLPELGNSEFGAVAVAFDAVCGEALLAAAEHARTHAGYSQVLVNVFRRSQTLVQRQLQIVEQLERSERNPDQLTKLYTLDHLVTRMRRNNENVLVLSGTELTRRSTRPIAVQDVVQAAVSEIEQYQRVSIVELPTAKVGDAAASDLIRMLAEVLDNATAFSAPELNVRVQGALLPDGTLTISVLDAGIGMSDEEISQANERLTKVGSAELSRSRQVGLLVVGRLAGRHGFGVQLLGGDNVDGVTAVITVPAELVVKVNAAGSVAVGAERLAPSPGVRRLAVVPTLPDTPAADRPTRRKSARPETPGDQPANAPELVAQAHADVPTDLPVRKPRRPAHATPPDAAAATPLPVRKRPADRAASRWFRARDTADQPREVSLSLDVLPSAGEGRRDNWSSPADEGWNIVETVSRADTYQYTEDGLPIRERGKQLVPGSPQARIKAAAQIERDPTQTRSRLSSYQQGVEKAKTGRHRAQPERSGWNLLSKGK